MHVGQGAGETLTSALAVCLCLSPSLSRSPYLHTDASSYDTVNIYNSSCTSYSRYLVYYNHQHKKSIMFPKKHTDFDFIFYYYFIFCYLSAQAGGVTPFAEKQPFGP